MKFDRKTTELLLDDDTIQYYFCIVTTLQFPGASIYALKLLKVSKMALLQSAGLFL